MLSVAKSKAFAGTLAALGLIAILWSLVWGGEFGSPRFLAYLGAAVLCSALTARRNTLQGPVTLNVIFVILGLVELTAVETITLGCTPALLQCLLNTRQRPRAREIAITLGSLAAAIASAGFAYRSLVPVSAGNVHLRLMLATLTFFVMNTFPAAAATGLAEGRRFATVWRESYQWTFPYYVVGAAMSGIVHLTAGSPLSSTMTLLVIPVVYLIYRSYHLQMMAAEQQKRHVAQITDLYHRSIEGLALAVEARDADTRSHLVRVQSYSVEVAARMGLPDTEVESLRVGSILHDVGKMAVPEYILSKPGRLTPEEFNKVKTHAVIGAEILTEMGFPSAVVEIVRHHHERWNGTGYPAGLAGKEIPIGARILAATDSLDALSSDRDYRRAYPLDRAMAMVEAEAGRSYDPEVVAALKSCYVEAAANAQNNPRAGQLAALAAQEENMALPGAGFEAGDFSGAELGLEDTLASVAAAQREGRLLLELTQGLVGAADSSEVFHRVAGCLRELAGYDCLAFFLPAGGEVLEAAYAEGDGAVYLWSLASACGDGLVGWVAQERKAILNGNPSVEPSLSAEAQAELARWSVIATPLESQGHAAGVLAVYRKRTDGFTVDHLRLLRRVGSVAELALENARRFQNVAQLAKTDYLTELPNSRALFELLEQIIARSRESRDRFGVAVCDLDGFKQVNDTRGHLAGDELLRGVARSMRAAAREADCIARMGGDEFVVVMPGADDELATGQLLRLAESVREGGEDGSAQASLSVSTGLAIFPEDGEDAMALLAAADRRMYEAKARRPR
jgi:diguanylate cyclase (GGDEF)-like protein/putative nucleotidyltransferase with HDIG domain